KEDERNQGNINLIAIEWYRLGTVNAFCIIRQFLQVAVNLHQNKCDDCENQRNYTEDERVLILGSYCLTSSWIFRTTSLSCCKSCVDVIYNGIDLPCSECGKRSHFRSIFILQRLCIIILSNICRRIMYPIVHFLPVAPRSAAFKSSKRWACQFLKYAMARLAF